MREIELTKGYKALVDDEDYSAVNEYTWYVFFSASNIYAKTFIKLENNKRKSLFMHQLVYELSGQIASNSHHIDHKDCNGLNNCRTNIRQASYQNNQANSRKMSKSSSVYKGVSFSKTRNKWEAYIKVNKIKINLGRFSDEREAANSYNIAAMKYFGEFARINIL